MTNAQTEYLEIVKNVTLETLAKSNNTTQEMVILGLSQGNENLMSQFNKLINSNLLTGMPQAMGVV